MWIINVCVATGCGFVCAVAVAAAADQTVLSNDGGKKEGEREKANTGKYTAQLANVCLSQI